MTTPQYFAQKPVDECVADCFDKIDKFYMYLNASGQWQLFLNSYKAYHRPGINLGETLRYGDKGQYMDITVNHYRNLIEHAVAMIVNQRVEYSPKAMNTDYKSQAQTILAKGLLEYYHRTNNFDQLIYKMIRDGFLYGESYLYLGWDPTKGEIVNVDSESAQTFREGDLKAKLFNTVDVIRDPQAPVNMDRDWDILVERVNKFDLATQYPQLAEKILATSDKKRSLAFEFVFNEAIWTSAMGSDDYTVKYTLVHRKTPTLPEGRLVEFLDDKIVLFDSPLPYDTSPVHKFYISEQEGSPFSYSHAWDVLPLQDNIDRLTSAVVTNNAAFAMQSILMPEGAQISEDAVNKGLLVLKYKGDKKPEALQLTQSAPETYNLIDRLAKSAETILGVGSIGRNNSDALKTSGSALALLQSIDVQFNQQIQAHYVFFLERVGTSILYILKQYANTRRVALITGKHNRQYLREFDNSDIDLIQRVYVDMGNPVMRTLAGNYELATTLVNQGVVNSVDALVEVLSTGRVEPAYESKQAEQMLIRSENENLSDGKLQQALITDNHVLHIKEHMVVLSNPQDRQNPEMVNAALAHIQQHMDLMDAMPPALQLIHGMPMVPQLGDAAAAPMMPAEPEMPNMPEMPTNPATGEKA